MMKTVFNICRIFGHKFNVWLGWSDWIITDKCYRCGVYKDGKEHDQREIRPVTLTW